MPIQTPICDFGQKAHDFKLKSTDNKIISLDEVKGFLLQELHDNNEQGADGSLKRKNPPNVLKIRELIRPP